MEKRVRIIRSFAEAEQADKEYYAALTPEQRLEILVELNRRLPQPDHADTPEGPARVYRITQLA